MKIINNNNFKLQMNNSVGNYGNYKFQKRGN